MNLATLCQSLVYSSMYENREMDVHVQNVIHEINSNDCLKQCRPIQEIVNDLEGLGYDKPQEFNKALQMRRAATK